MRSHRLAGPDRTHFACRVVADSKYEIIPALASQLLRRTSIFVEQLERPSVHSARWMTPGTESTKTSGAATLEKRLGHDAVRGVSGPEKEHVVDCLVHDPID